MILLAAALEAGKSVLEKRFEETLLQVVKEIQKVLGDTTSRPTPSRYCNFPRLVHYEYGHRSILPVCRGRRKVASDIRNNGLPRHLGHYSVNHLSAPFAPSCNADWLGVIAAK